ncbi:MAG: hypothetical protein U9Q15_04000 [Patescibacteria group bacterium]|nr:hypothetical protein [Patescibacteria group bacterium]
MITGGSDSSRREKGVSLLKYVSIAILILMFAYPLVAWFFSLGPDG